MWRRLVTAARWRADTQSVSARFAASSFSSSSASAAAVTAPKCLRDIQHSIANCKSSDQVDHASELLRSTKLFWFDAKRSQVDLWHVPATTTTTTSSSSSGAEDHAINVFQTRAMAEFDFARFDQRHQSHEHLLTVTKMTPQQQQERGIPTCCHGFFLNEFVALQWLFQAYYNQRDAVHIHQLFLEMVRKLQQLPSANTTTNTTTTTATATQGSSGPELSVRDVLERLLPPIRTGQFLASVHATLDHHHATNQSDDLQEDQARPAKDVKASGNNTKDPMNTRAIHEQASRFCAQHMAEMPVLALFFAGRGHTLPHVWKKGENVQFGFEILRKMVHEGSELPFNYNTFKNALINNLFFHPDQTQGLQNALAIANWMTQQAGFFVPNRAWGAIMTRLFDAQAPVEEMVTFLKERPVYNQSHQLLYALSNLLKTHQRTDLALVLLQEFMESADQVASAKDQEALLTYLLHLMIDAGPSVPVFEQYMKLMAHNGTKAGRNAGYSVVDFFLNPMHHPGKSKAQIAQKFAEFWGSVALIFAPLEFPAVQGAQVILDHSKVLDATGLWDIDMEPFVKALEGLEKADRVALTHYLLWRLIQKPKRIVQLRHAIGLLNDLDTFVDGKTLRHVVEYYLHRVNHGTHGKRHAAEIVQELLQVAQANDKLFNSPSLLLQFALPYCMARKWRAECDQLVQFGKQKHVVPNAITLQKLQRFYQRYGGHQVLLDEWLKCVQQTKR